MLAFGIGFGNVRRRRLAVGRAIRPSPPFMPPYSARRRLSSLRDVNMTSTVMMELASSGCPAIRHDAARDEDEEHT